MMSAKRKALSDIGDWFIENKIKTNPGSDDQWIITPWSIDNKETRRLNKELGIHKINKQQNGINFKQNKTKNGKKRNIIKIHKKS